MATVLSLATTRSVCTVKIQFRSLRLVRRNAVPFSSAATLNLALNSPIYRPRRKLFAPSTVVIPADTFAQIKTALTATDQTTVPCNNDLLAGNFIEDGERVWIIDYEYSGNNDPCFELGNIWSECRLSIEQLDELVTAYYGRRLRHKIARAHLQGIVAKYGWTLWGCIQSASSALEFDFWAWAMERYEAAVAEFNGPHFARLLDDVHATD